VYNIGDKYDAAAGKYGTCRLAIRDGLLARLEVVSWPAATIPAAVRRQEPKRCLSYRSLSQYL